MARLRKRRQLVGDCYTINKVGSYARRRGQRVLAYYSEVGGIVLDLFTKAVQLGRRD
jgi:hypothetical protein